MNLLAISTFNALSGGLGLCLIAFGFMRWRQSVAARAEVADSAEE